jgi:hypothetical protein
VSPRRNKKLKFAAYAGAVLFSGLVWLGIIMLGWAMTTKEPDEAALSKMVRPGANATPGAVPPPVGGRSSRPDNP